MKLNFKNIPDSVNQPFELPAEGTYHLVISKAEFALSGSGGTNLNMEIAIKGSNNHVKVFNPLKSAAGEQVTFGLARLKRILTVLDKVPEMELDLSNAAHQKMLISLIIGGEFITELYHRNYTYNGEERTALDIKDWDNLTPIVAKTETPSTEKPTVQVNQDIAELVEDDDIVI